MVCVAQTARRPNKHVAAPRAPPACSCHRGSRARRGRRTPGGSRCTAQTFGTVLLAARSTACAGGGAVRSTGEATTRQQQMATAMHAERQQQPAGKQASDRARVPRDAPLHACALALGALRRRLGQLAAAQPAQLAALVLVKGLAEAPHGERRRVGERRVGRRLQQEVHLVGEVPVDGAAASGRQAQRALLDAPLRALLVARQRAARAAGGAAPLGLGQAQRRLRRARGGGGRGRELDAVVCIIVAAQDVHVFW